MTALVPEALRLGEVWANSSRVPDYSSEHEAGPWYSLHRGALTGLLHSGGKLWFLVASGWVASSGITNS